MSPAFRFVQKTILSYGFHSSAFIVSFGDPEGWSLSQLFPRHPRLGLPFGSLLLASRQGLR